MFIMDRHLLVILAITGIMSTAVVSLLFHERVEGPIEVLRQDWNLPRVGGRILIPEEEGRYAYTLAVVARRPVAELVLGFALLENCTLDVTSTRMNPSNPTDVPEFGAFLSAIGEYQETDNATGQPFRAQLDQWEAELSVFDLTDAFSALAPPETLRELATVHAILARPGGSVDYFQGSKDFFLERDSALVDLTIQINENVTKYGQRESTATGTLDLGEAPPLGILRFADLRKYDRVSVTIAFNPARVSGSRSLLDVVTIHADGTLNLAKAHLLEHSSTVMS
jgi:hypothetical protein